MGIFKETMERHKRMDSWIVAILLVVLFFYSLWINNLALSIISFTLTFVLPFIFPKPKKKIKFIDEFIDWEIAWTKLPLYSKLIDWFIEAVGFVTTVYGAWYHNLFLIFIGVIIIAIGLIDFLVRFGYKRAILKFVSWQKRNSTNEIFGENFLH